MCVLPSTSIDLTSLFCRGVIPILQSLHCEISEVATDSEGVSSQSLRQILESWPAEKPKPKILYTVPVSPPSNPRYLILRIHLAWL